MSEAEIIEFRRLANLLRLTQFEIDFLGDLEFFKSLSVAALSDEALPECFHIWAARRNSIDVFLTLEKRLPRFVQQLESRGRNPLRTGVLVLRPTDLLGRFGVSECDEVPVQGDHFYAYMEVFRIMESLEKR
jgi:hypothetical protein